MTYREQTERDLVTQIIRAKDAEIERLRKGFYQMAKQFNYSGDGKFIIWEDGRPVRWIQPAEFARQILEGTP